jgi:phosphate transport system substrate-binding protein
MHTSSSQESRRHPGFGALFLLALCLLLVACGTDTTPSHARGASCPSTSPLQGAGSTFDAPLFAQMFASYASTSCGLAVSYLSSGSGAGQFALRQQEVDFAATDVPLTDAVLASSPHGPILHIPMTLGTEAIVYNMPGVVPGLKPSGPVLASIFQGRITTWDDPAITQLNSGVSLPHLRIIVIHRSDGSGTTGILTQYLSEISPAWKAQVGAGLVVNWPVGVGERGNGGSPSASETSRGPLATSNCPTHSVATCPLRYYKTQQGTSLPPPSPARRRQRQVCRPFRRTCASSSQTRRAPTPIPSQGTPG